MPLVFTPVYSDSTARYDIDLVVRHTNRYPYATLQLAVDLLGDSAGMKRKDVTFRLADERGNWTGAGFASLFQVKTTIAQGVTPQTARHVSVWQTASNTITVNQISEVGIIVHPADVPSQSRL